MLPPPAVAPAHAEDEFLPPTEAFKVEARVSDGQLTVEYRIAPGYYLYRDRLGFESATPGVTLGAPQFPVGEDHEDEYFGRQVVYRDTATIAMPVNFVVNKLWAFRKPKVAVVEE